MKTSLYSHKNTVHRQRGFLEVDLVVATAILAVAILPVSFAFTHERRVLRAEYYRSVAVELVDGEAEILAAGAGRDFPDGTQESPLHTPAAASLPPGIFQLTKAGGHARLEWTPAKRLGVGVVTREFNIK